MVLLAALHVVLYSVPDLVSVDVVDAQGNAVNYFVTVPLACEVPSN